jgi:metallophosphoesterase superfamily enzyme
MQSRRLIVSDLHFGSGDDLLRSAVALERIEPELRWADELVINGDLLELVFASLEDAVAAARPFLQLVNRHVGRVHYVLGNHDHHLVTLAGDERRFADVLGAPAPGPDVAPATRLLRTLCPDVDVVSAYPVY